MLYDGECPLCMRETNMLRARDAQQGSIDFVNIASPDYSPRRNAGLEYETVMGEIHALLPDATIVTKVRKPYVHTRPRAGCLRRTLVCVAVQLSLYPHSAPWQSPTAPWSHACPHGVRCCGQLHTLQSDVTRWVMCWRMQVEVFRRLYEAVGLGWLYAITKIPWVERGADAVYDFWARYRLPITGRPALLDVMESRRREGQNCRTSKAEVPRR